MKKIAFTLIGLILLMFCSCEQVTGIAPESGKVNVYFCGGQSNANKIWYETIKDEILKVDPDAVIIHNNHPGNEISNWFTDSPKKNYIEDITKIKNNLPENDYIFSGLFWYQGESDYKIPEEYENKFNGLISELENDLGFYDFPIFMNIVSTNTASKGYDGIRAVQFNIVESNKNIHGSDTYGYERIDCNTSHMPDYCYVGIGMKTAKIAIDVLY